MKRQKRTKIRHIFSTFKYIAHFAYKVDSGLFVGVMIINILWGLSSVPTFYIEKQIIDTLINNVGTSNVRNAAFNVTFFVILYLLIQLLRNVLASLNNYTRSVMSRLMDMEMIAQIGAKHASLDLATIEDPDFRDTFDRLEKEISRRSWGLMLSLTDIPNYLVGFISGIIVISLISPLVTLGIILVSIPKLFADVRYIREEYEMNKEIAPKRRMWGWLNNYLMRNSNYMELKLLDLLDHLKQSMVETGKDIARVYLRVRKRRTIVGILTDLPFLFFELGISIFLVFQVISSLITIGTFQLYIRSLRLAQSNFSGLVLALTEIYESYVYVNDLMWLMDLKTETDLIKGSKEVLDDISTITFENVKFKYKEDTPYVLRGVDFSIKKGEKIAIVGENGAGKTTLIKLLGRFYDPTSGNILVSEKNLSSIDPKKWRNRLGILFQLFELYPFTAEQSIVFGDLKRKYSKKDVIDAAKKAGIHEFIDGLPKKYENPLTPHFEKGIQPSIGQYQRIGIARLLFRKRAEVMVLDEPTSNVDPEAEEKIFRELKKITKEKILIFITQRFSTVKIADRIFVMDKGRIIEQGSHKELMLRNGKYARLFTLQAEAYLEHNKEKMSLHTGIKHSS